MNEKEIDLLTNEIKFLDMKMEEAKELDSSLYRNGYEDLRDFFKSSYEIERLKEELENKLDLYKKLTEKGIDVNKNYYLFNSIYLSISELSPFFYIEDAQWIYDNYINSWSGINEWITDLIDREYSLFTGNSPHCHAFGTVTIKDIFRRIEDKEVHNCTKVRLIENLIEFTKSDGELRELHNKVVESIKLKLNTMKEDL